MDTDGKYQPRRYETFINLILSCLLKVTDRYALAREFDLARFELAVMKCEDFYELQTMCVRLYAQTKAQQSVYESLLRDVRDLPPGQ